MLETGLQLIQEEFFAERVRPSQMDVLWSKGWRHFGDHFFRYNLGFLGLEMRDVVPLRIRLSDFSPSSSQLRVLRKNADARVLVGPANIDETVERLFHLHKRRFKENVPTSIYDFVGMEPGFYPCEMYEVRVEIGGRLAAISFFDVGDRAASGIYGMFHPGNSRRSLGIFTMLKEIEFAIGLGMEFYYQGYCYDGESFYDYKKRFRGSESYDWNGNWFRFVS